MQVTPVIDDAGDHARATCAASPSSGRRRSRGSRSGRGGCPSSRSDHDEFRALLDRSTRGPRRAADLRPRVPRPRRRRRRRAVVHDAVRPRLAAHVVDDDARRPRPRARHACRRSPASRASEVDPLTEEEPGRILHEMRFGETASLALGGGRIYYGTVDATPLFVMLVGELSRWGNRRDEVDALLPAADRALAVDHRVRRQGRRRLRRVPAHDRSRACRTRVGRTPGTRCASPTARSRAHADRAVRGAGLRVRGARRPRRTARPRPATTSSPRRSGRAPPT